LATTPQSIVYLRPDTIGDLVIFSSALAQLQAAWPKARHTIVVRPGYETLAPLFSPALVWQLARFNPFAQKPSACRGELTSLLGELEKLSPDLILAPTHNRTWLEVAVAAHFPKARRVALGARDVDPIFATALRLELGVSAATAFGETVPADERETDWENQHRLVDHLLTEGKKGPRPFPSVSVPAASAAQAEKILAEKGLASGAFVAVFPAGLANVQVKAWPTEKFAQLILSLQRDAQFNTPLLLLGHVSEAKILEDVCAAVAKLGGTKPAFWLGRDGEVPVLAALLRRARFYVGHDTGAMHLAAAVGRPVVGIFGGGHGARFRPIGTQAVTVVQPLPCFGCNWDCHFGDGPCVKSLDVADVRRGIDQLVAAGTAPLKAVVEAANFPAESLRLIAASAPRFHALQADRLERQHKIEELKLEADIKDGEITSLKKEADTKDEEIADLKQETDGKDVEIEDLKKETDGKDVEIADLKRAATERKTEMEAIKAELEAECAEKDTEIAELKREANTKDAEIDRLKGVCNEREALIITLDGHVKEFQRMVGELNAAHGEKDKIIANAQATAAAHAAACESRAQELTAQAAKLERLAELENKLSALPPKPSSTASGCTTRTSISGTSRPW
jgi:ADP-heptose:LPS heptosyltransferase/predicted  nucleic acid-binding Zn-ribbon protein